MSVSRLGGSGDSPAQRSGKGKSDQEPLKGFQGPPSLYLISRVSPSSPPQPDWTETWSPDPTYFPISLLASGLKLDCETRFPAL